VCGKCWARVRFKVTSATAYWPLTGSPRASNRCLRKALQIAFAPQRALGFPLHSLNTAGSMRVPCR